MVQQQQRTNDKHLTKLKRIKTGLLSSPEGCILLLGVALALMYSFWLGIEFLYFPEEAQILIGMTATAIMFGRAAGMAFGYSLLLGHGTVIPVSMIIETILVLIFYPLFVFSWRHLLVLKPLKKFFNRIQKAAEANQDFVRKYGIIGLFAFVWFPFWMTGPVVGCVIGFLLGLPAWINILAVLGGTYIAITCWAILLHTVNQQVAHYSPYAAMILMAVLVVVIIVGHFLQKTLHENKIKHNSTNGNEPEQDSSRRSITEPDSSENNTGTYNMEKIEWDNSLSIGIDSIDQQHKMLIERLQAVFEAIESNQGEGAIAKTLDFLLDYADFHFAEEEKQMTEHDYPDSGLDLQKQQHEEFRDEVKKLVEDFELDGADKDIANHIRDFLFIWLKKHIRDVDLRFGQFLNEKG